MEITLVLFVVFQLLICAVIFSAGHLSVMLSVGNRLANSIWECETKGRRKPGLGSPRDEKEKWAFSKYIAKEFLASLDPGLHLPHHLIESVSR